MLTTNASFRLITRDLERSIKTVAAQPSLSREVAFYAEHIRDVKSIDDFLADDRLYSFAMKAFGLEEMTYAKAFMRKALAGGIDDKDSFANRLADKRYREFVDTFNFARYGADTTASRKVFEGTIDKYLRQTLEQQAGQQNEGVRLALYFQRKASTLTSAYSILADPALYKVVQVALGLPPQMPTADIDAQARIIGQRLKISDLQSPTKLSTLLERFTVLWEAGYREAAPSAASIISTRSSTSLFGIDLLASLQNLRRGS